MYDVSMNTDFKGIFTIIWYGPSMYDVSMNTDFKGIFTIIWYGPLISYQNNLFYRIKAWHQKIVAVTNEGGGRTTFG